MASSKTSEVVKIALSKSWIEFAIDAYKAGGGTLTADEESVLLKLTGAELEALAKVDQGLNPGGAAGDIGGIY